MNDVKNPKKNQKKREESNLSEEPNQILRSDENFILNDNLFINAYEYKLKPPYNYIMVLKEYCDNSHSKYDEEFVRSKNGDTFAMKIYLNDVEFGYGSGFF